MSARFLHTADWQLGKPFARIAEVEKRALMQRERINAAQRLREIARENKAEFILVAGDLFDSPTATRTTVSAACGAIGSLGIPVIAIPGNHDHGGPGSLWEQPFFQRECADLSPNFKVLLKSTPIELDSAVIFPCPLLRRAESADPTAWLRTLETSVEAYGQKPWIVLAHGSTQDFRASPDEDDPDTGATNLVDLGKFASQPFDYIALGDWHGTKQVAPKAWYSGTPELDRFPKGQSNNPGNVLMVVAARGQAPQVQVIRTAKFGWHEREWNFSDDGALDRLGQEIDSLVSTRTQEDLLRLDLTGSLSIDASRRLEQMIESWQARLLRLKLKDRSVVAPSHAEIVALTQRSGDPLISAVASQLVATATGTGENAAVARIALRELHSACLRT